MATTTAVTEKLAKSLQWRGEEYIAWDADLEGFGVRVWGPGNKRGYIIQTKHHGRSYRKALGKVGQVAAQGAREAAIAFRTAVRAGRDPRAEDKTARQAWTLQDAMDHFKGDYAEARKLSTTYKADSAAMFEHHTPDRWRTMKLSAFTQSMIVTRHKAITNGESTRRGGSRRANTWLSLMSRLFTLGMPDHCSANPVEGIKRNPEVERERFLSETELTTLWRYLDAHKNVEAAAAVQFILLTGCRPGEAYKARWADIDMTAGRWIKPATRTKQRKRHVVALVDMAVRVLQRLETHKRSEYVFPAPGDASQPRGDKLKAFWEAVRKNCALPDVRLYDCRHSFASWLAMGGASIIEIGAQLGHSNMQTTRRYVHLTDQHMRSRAELMSGAITRALSDSGDADKVPLVAERKRSGVVTMDLGAQSIISLWPPSEPEGEAGV